MQEIEEVQITQSDIQTYLNQKNSDGKIVMFSFHPNDSTKFTTITLENTSVNTVQVVKFMDSSDLTAINAYVDTMNADSFTVNVIPQRDNSTDMILLSSKYTPI